MTMSKFFILFIASLSLILSSCSTNTKTGNLNTEIVKKNNTTKKNINYYQKCKANITNKTEDFTEENEADIRMNMFCKFHIATSYSFSGLLPHLLFFPSQKGYNHETFYPFALVKLRLNRLK